VEGFFLRRTLELAQSRRGFCSPNPAVGALLERDGRILAEGFHKAAGQPHAEVEALRDLPLEITQGATLYVSLEPCCHHGRTPPCTDLIIQKGIAEVVYAYRDPNPVVAGRGEAVLLSAGVEVRQVPLAEVDEFYQSYAHWTQTGLPFTTVKLAISLDGKTAGPGGLPLPLTGPEANRFTHERRLRSDAILTTARTVLADDPRLNVRLHGVETPKPVVILDRLGRTPATARIFQTAQSVTIYTGEDVPAERSRALADQGATVIAVDTSNGLLPLRQILGQLGQTGYHDLWVEGGAALFTAFLKERLAQRAFIYVAPVIVGAGVSAFEAPWAGLLSDAHLVWTPQGRDVVAEVVW
jgi:diaminohydroxyphosphoribosylaminopyrimidine deaminase / 5-amino-6-(5-phosphoribosylamino)uracil reductase